MSLDFCLTLARVCVCLQVWYGIWMVRKGIVQVVEMICSRSMNAGGRSESSGKGAIWKLMMKGVINVLGNLLNKLEIGLAKCKKYVSYG